MPVVGAVANADALFCEVHSGCSWCWRPVVPQHPKQCGVWPMFYPGTLDGHRLSHACHAFCLFLKGRDGGMRLQKLQTSWGLREPPKWNEYIPKKNHHSFTNNVAVVDNGSGESRLLVKQCPVPSAGCKGLSTTHGTGTYINVCEVTSK